MGSYYAPYNHDIPLEKIVIVNESSRKAVYGMLAQFCREIVESVDQTCMAPPRPFDCAGTMVNDAHPSTVFAKSDSPVHAT